MANKPVIGIDIGASAIRGVQVSFNKANEPIVEKVGYIPLEPESISNGAVVDKDAVVAALKRLHKEAKFTTNNVRLAVGGEGVISRLAELDWSDDKTFGRILPFLVRDSLPIEISDYLLDYHTLSEYVKKEQNPEDEEEYIMKPKKYVLVVGAEKKLVQSHVDAIMGAGLHPVSVDIQSLALIRTARTGDRALGDFADINIDIGADNLTIVVHKFGQPLYIRTISDIGGRVITQDIAKDASIPYSKAEKRKFDSLYVDLDATDQSVHVPMDSVFKLEDETELPAEKVVAEPMDIEYKNKLNRARPIVSGHMSGIVAVIRETVENFLYSDQDNDLNHFAPFTLSGGVAGTPNFAERLSSEFRNSVTLAAPLSSLEHKDIPDIYLDREHEFTVAVGIAVGKGASHGY